MFGAFALGLSAIGIYGVIAYVVQQRTREFGIRMAVGSTPGGIFKLVLRDGRMLAGSGLIFGVAGALVAGYLVRDLLFESNGVDPVVMGGVVAVLLLAAICACLAPALRATRMNPVAALRAE